MQRRDFIKVIAGSATALPLVARAQHLAEFGIIAPAGRNGVALMTIESSGGAAVAAAPPSN
jgi:hypothetical protein